MRQTMKVSGEGKVHAVIGGLHLFRAPFDDYVRQTVTELVTSTTGTEFTVGA